MMQVEDKTVWVVVPVFNRKDYTKKCLRLLSAQTYRDLRVVVVDDGSTDGTDEMVRTEFPSVELIRGMGDWYWTGSVYQGVEYVLEKSKSNDDYVFILNDDLEFGPDLLGSLVDFIKVRPRSIVQALGSWTDRPKIIHYAGVEINRWSAKRKDLYAADRRDDFPEQHVVKVDALTGRGVLFPIQVFREVGNYDRRIIHRGDPELTQRALKAGWELLIYFGAVVYSIPVKGRGNVNEREVYHWSDTRDYFFGVLSSSHIPTLWRNSCAYTHSKVQAIVFFCCTLSRHSWHFIKKLNLN